MYSTSVVPREAIDSLWLSFNLHGEGWGLDLEEFRNIFSGADYIHDNLGLHAPPSLPVLPSLTFS